MSDERTTPRGGSRGRSLASRPLLWLAAILLLGAGLRVFLFLDYRERMPVDFVDLTELDNHTWHVFGERIAGGDILYRDAFNPVHSWARRIAPPEQWTAWYGGPSAYYQAPLYGYMVGAVYAASGTDPDHVRAFQLLLGLVRVVLVYAIARRLFPMPAPLIAAFLAAIYSPALFFELTLLRASFLIVLHLTALLLLILAYQRGRLRWWALAGLVMGLEFLAKPSPYLLAAPVLVLVAERGWRGRVRAVAAYALLFAIPLGILAARNLAVGQPALQVSTRGPITFISGNAPDGVAGGPVGFDVPPSSRDILLRTGNAFLPTVAEVLKRNLDDPGAYLRKLGAKARAFWRDYEVPNNVNYHHMRNVLGLLRLPFSSFGFVFALAMVGLAATWPERRRLLPLYLFMALIFVYTAAFIVLARMRLVITPYLILFAAAGLVWIARALVRRDGRRLAAAVLILLAALIVSGRPPGWAPDMMSSRVLLRDLGVYRDYLGQIDPAVERELPFAEARTTLYAVKRDYEDGRYEACLDPLMDVLESYPDLNFTRYVLARCYFELYLRDTERIDYLERAREELDDVLTREPGAPYASGLQAALAGVEERRSREP